MKRWQGSCIGAFLVLLIGGGSLIFLVPFGGAMIAGIPPLFDRLTAYVLCPDAANYSYSDFGNVPIDSTNPSGGTGHYTELTVCNWEQPLALTTAHAARTTSTLRVATADVHWAMIYSCLCSIKFCAPDTS